MLMDFGVLVLNVDKTVFSANITFEKVSAITPAESRCLRLDAWGTHFQARVKTG
jgi:hypothetical protein